MLNKKLAIIIDTRILIFDAFLLHVCFLHHSNLDLKTVAETQVSRKEGYTNRWVSLPKTQPTISSLIQTSASVLIFCLKKKNVTWTETGLFEGSELLKICRVEDEVMDSPFGSWVSFWSFLFWAPLSQKINSFWSFAKAHFSCIQKMYLAW